MTTGRLSIPKSEGFGVRCQPSLSKGAGYRRAASLGAGDQILRGLKEQTNIHEGSFRIFHCIPYWVPCKRIDLLVCVEVSIDIGMKEPDVLDVTVIAVKVAFIRAFGLGMLRIRALVARVSNLQTALKFCLKSGWISLQELSTKLRLHRHPGDRGWPSAQRKLPN